MKAFAGIAAVFVVWWAIVLGPGAVLAADFPAMADGGVVTTYDAGFYVCATACQGASCKYTKGGWDSVIRCPTIGAHYVLCKDATCVPTMSNQYLAPDVTYDISVPGELDTLCIGTFDAGIPACTWNYRRNKGE